MAAQKFGKLIQICTEETHFKDFEGNIWTQIDVTAIAAQINFW